VKKLGTKMSNVAVASFRWLDLLEKELDKTMIDFDLSLTDLRKVKNYWKCLVSISAQSADHLSSQL